jgi:hypothetical protein
MLPVLLTCDDPRTSWFFQQGIERDHGPTCVASEQKFQADEKDVTDASTKCPDDEGAASLNANEVLMLHRSLKIIQERAAQANLRESRFAKRSVSWSMSMYRLIKSL